ncbi:hypothetical protein JCM11251_005460 [Rhodosporidiobolus azoricus]
MDPPAHQAQRVAAQGSSRGVQADQKGANSGASAQVRREAKGLALELKGLLKRKEPWDRTVEFQRESLRKAYLRIIFSPASSSASTLASRTSAADTTLRARGSSAAPSASSPSSRQVEILNLLWLDTSHAFIQSYRARLAQLDKELATAPNAHKTKNRNGGSGGGDVQHVGPVARRKLVHSFRQFLSLEEDFWRTICGRVASRLYPEEASELRSLGIIASSFSFESVVASSVDGAADEDSEEAIKARRAAVLPLAHKALICFGDLARYSELYSEAQQQQHPTAGRGGRGRGRAGKQQQTAQQGRSTKNFSKAADCYSQARQLIPDNGNPSNQLAVLAQYASDPLSSVYHYYRALSVRQPFITAQANLQITFKKAVAKWFAAGSAEEAEGGEVEAGRFKVVFVTLLGVLFTKAHLADSSSLSGRATALFATCTSERQLTSDVVLKITVAALAALWDARMSRSGVSTKPSSIAPAAPSTAVSSSNTAEPHLLILLLSLYTVLLRCSSAETNELYSSNMASLSPSEPAPTLAQNISAVLRRSLPALRVLHKWLLAQLDYIHRVEARLEAAERKRARDARRKARTSTGTEEDAQRASSSLGEGGESAGSEKLRANLTVAELRSTLDGLWEAMADFGNSMLLAFPSDELPSQLLAGADDTGGNVVWLEEDVELLGFAPLRRSGSLVTKGDEGGRPREMRKVGRDVHPNEEQLMRIKEGQGEVERLAESALTRFSFDDGAYIFHSRGEDEPSQQSSASLDARQLVTGRPSGMQVDRVASSEKINVEEEEEEDAEMLDQATEDDPVDRAMRVNAADKLDMDGLESDLEENEEDDSDDEQILFEGNRSMSRSGSLAPNGSPLTDCTASATTAPPQRPSITASTAPRTADDLRQLLLSGGSPAISRTTSYEAPPFPTNPPAIPSSNLSSPSLSRHASVPVPPHGPGVQSIWAPAAGVSASPLFHTAPAAQAAAAVSSHSFEAIPNITHGSPAAQVAGWGWSSMAQQQQHQEHQQYPHHQHYPQQPPQHHPPQHRAAPPISSGSAAALFGGSSAFSPPSTSALSPGAGLKPPFPVYRPHVASGSSSRTLPLPPPPALSTAFAGVGPTSPFSNGPFSPNHQGGNGPWPAMPGNAPRGNGYG